MARMARYITRSLGLGLALALAAPGARAAETIRMRDVSCAGTIYTVTAYAPSKAPMAKRGCSSRSKLFSTDP